MSLTSAKMPSLRDEHIALEIANVPVKKEKKKSKVALGKAETKKKGVKK